MGWRRGIRGGLGPPSYGDEYSMGEGVRDVKIHPCRTSCRFSFAGGGWELPITPEGHVSYSRRNISLRIIIQADSLFECPANNDFIKWQLTGSNQPATHIFIVPKFRRPRCSQKALQSATLGMDLWAWDLAQTLFVQWFWPNSSIQLQKEHLSNLCEIIKWTIRSIGDTQTAPIVNVGTIKHCKSFLLPLIVECWHSITSSDCVFKHYVPFDAMKSCLDFRDTVHLYWVPSLHHVETHAWSGVCDHLYQQIPKLTTTTGEMKHHYSIWSIVIKFIGHIVEVASTGQGRLWSRWPPSRMKRELSGSRSWTLTLDLSKRARTLSVGWVGVFGKLVEKI